MSVTGPYTCCDKEMHHLFNASEQKTTGWWCQICNKVMSAIGREFQLRPEDHNNGSSNDSN